MQKQLLTLCICFIGFMHTAMATTHIYVQNNTDIDFGFDIIRYTGNSSSFVSKHVNGIGAYKRDVKVSSFGRNYGVKWGKTYGFHNQLTIAGTSQKIQLKLQLTGTWNRSTISAGYNVTGTNNDFWSDLWGDRNIRTSQTFTLADGRSYRIKMRFLYTGGDDDILYVIEYANQSQVVNTSDYNNPNILNVAAWNIWQLPTFSSIPNARYNYVDDWLAPYEVLIISEAFDNSNRESIKNQLKQRGFANFTSVVDNPNNIKQDGGVFIASRYPILDSEQELFDDLAANGDDQSNKGVMYAKINKLGKNYHVLGTHAQSGGSYASYRTKNFKEIINLRNRKNIPSNEPVIIGGDLNVNKFTASEYNGMLGTLQANDPQRIGSYTATYSGITNGWIGSSNDQILDYVLYSSAHQQPVSSTTRVFVPRHTMLSHPGLNSNDEWRSVVTDISDHYGVHARFVFGASKETKPKNEIVAVDNQEEHIEAIIKNEFKVFPNPVKTVLNIKLPENSTDGLVQIIDASGRVLITHEIEEEGTQRIDVRDLPRGMYITRFINKTGEAKMKKVVVK
ncbi:exported hypothetical protein [Tenacibaculum sp. 190524A02b]|uniref:T9SS type A sorting domain-containing protein n=1 Tax=Tenacibaculum vairaonense TaxID=3137860 RepID=A0ABP1FIU5_9FLAO